MADNDQERTELVSQRKLKESRDRGELPRSQELNTFVIFALFLLFFGMSRLGWFEDFAALMGDLLRFDRHLGITAGNLHEFLLSAAVRAIIILAPLFGIILIVSPVLSMCQTGFNIAHEKLSPDWSRLDPVAGARRFASAHQWIEGGKSCLKIALFAWLAWRALAKYLDRIMLMGALDLRGQISLMLDVSLAIGIRITILMAVMAILDFGWQWWEFIKRMRMTHQEAKDEMKEHEGNPLIKSRQRSLAMQRARQRMMAAVPQANVVVTNPTHFAVALTYDRNKAPAPIVCAKGRQLMAQRIKELAREHGIPIVENKPLARALYKNVKVGRMIPAEFYKAIAEVLAFVFMLKSRRGTARGTHVMSRKLL